MIRSNKAFTLVELLIAISILFFVITITMIVTMSMDKNYNILIAHFTSLLKGREVTDAISKDCRIAVRVMDSYAGYVTTDSSIVFKVPSIDSAGNIIDVNKFFDYIIYGMVGSNLRKTVIPSTVSARAPENSIFKESIESLHMESNGLPLSQIAHKSVITRITMWVSINENILGRNYRIIPGTTVKLMNYEWEYVR